MSPYLGKPGLMKYKLKCIFNAFDCFKLHCNVFQWFVTYFSATFPMNARVRLCQMIKGLLTFIWARFPGSRLTSQSEAFVKFWMCSYERAGLGWLGSRDLGLSNRDLSERAGKFCHTVGVCSSKSLATRRGTRNLNYILPLFFFDFC